MSKTYSAGIVTAYGAAKRAGYHGTYEDFCRQQAGYAGNAAAVEAAKTSAQTAANTATAKAGEATTAATAAQTAKTQTEAAASQALTDISTARSGAISAVQTEGATQTANATAQAQAAAQSATTASAKASEASASATSAGQSATNAAASATSAAQSASDAQDVLDSIPADYSEMSADVEQLKADLDYILVTKNGSLTPWVQGYLHSENGTVGTDSTRCISYFFRAGSRSIKLTASTGYVIEKVCEYDATLTFIAAYINLNITDPTDFNINSDHYYRLQVAKTDGTAFAPTDITDSMFTVTHMVTDTTLTKSEKAADSETVGDAINAFSERLINESDLINGYIDFTRNGKLTQNSKRLGLNKKLPICCDTFIEFEYGDIIDRVYIELYDKFGNLIRYASWSGIEKIRIDTDDADYIYLIFKNSNEVEIALSDFDASVIITPSTKVKEKVSHLNQSVFVNAESGSISDETGEPISGENDRLFRSKEFIDVQNADVIVLKNCDGMELYVFEYNANKEFVTASSSAYLTNKPYVLSSNTNYIKIVARITNSDELFDFKANTVIVVGLSSIVVKIPMEAGVYSSSTIYGTSPYAFNSYIVNSYPVIINPYAEAYLFYNGISGTVIFRNSAGTSISSSRVLSGDRIIVPSETAYLDIEIKTNNIMDDSVYITTCGKKIKNDVNILNKRIATNGGNRISVVYRLGKGNDLITYANLLLPQNYSIDKKVPCILWMDGSGHMTSWGSSFSDKLPYLEYLRDEGFAILSIFAWGYNYSVKYPNCGKAYPYPVPTNLAFIKAGLEYVCDRYSIDPDNIHIMSKSQGGQCAFYFASHPIWNFKSIGMFAPVLDYLSMPGEPMYADTRKAIAEDLGLTGNVEYFTSVDYLGYSSDALAFWESNLHQIIGFNEAYTNLNGDTALENVRKSVSDCAEFWTDEAWNTPDRADIYNHHEYKKFAKIPVKIWGASDDNKTPFHKMAESISQLQNGGTEAVLRTFNRGTGGHSCADVGSNYVAEVTTALGITHTNVRTGWIENVEWIRQHMAK